MSRKSYEHTKHLESPLTQPPEEKGKEAQAQEGIKPSRLEVYKNLVLGTEAKAVKKISEGQVLTNQKELMRVYRGIEAWRKETTVRQEFQKAREHLASLLHPKIQPYAKVKIPPQRDVLEALDEAKKTAEVLEKQAKANGEYRKALQEYRYGLECFKNAFTIKHKIYIEKYKKYILTRQNTLKTIEAMYPQEDATVQFNPIEMLRVSLGRNPTREEKQEYSNIVNKFMLREREQGREYTQGELLERGLLLFQEKNPNQAVNTHVKGKEKREDN